MIDFPASPTDGQIFSATNGVVYKYSTTYTSWLAQNPAPALGGTGDILCDGHGLAQLTRVRRHRLFPATVVTGNALGFGTRFRQDVMCRPLEDTASLAGRCLQ